MLACIVSDALPQPNEDNEIERLAVHTGSSQLDQLGAKRLEDVELKFLRAVVSEMRRCIVARLQTVGTNDMSCAQVLHDEMVADGVKPVFVQASEVRLLKSFVEFEVEDL